VTAALYDHPNLFTTADKGKRYQGPTVYKARIKPAVVRTVPA
jgi:hypothetical protein